MAKNNAATVTTGKTSTAPSSKPTLKVSVAESALAAKLAALEAQLKERVAKEAESLKAKATREAEREAAAAAKVRERTVGFNPLCILHGIVAGTIKPIGARVVAIITGKLHEATVVGLKGSSIMVVPAGVTDDDGQPVEMTVHGSFVFADAATAVKAVKWASDTVTTPLADLNPAKQAGEGAGTEHTGRPVCVFRMGEHGYQNEESGFARGFGYSPGFLDTVPPAVKGRISVYYGHGDADEIDTHVEPSNVYDSRCYTDPLTRSLAVLRTQRLIAEAVEAIGQGKVPVVKFPAPKAEEPAKATSKKVVTEKAAEAKAPAAKVVAKGGKQAKK